MANLKYSEHYRSMYGEVKKNPNAVHFQANTIGSNISPTVPAEPGEFKEFGFTANTGFTYNYANEVGLGTGTLTADSAALFPIAGDDKPYVITLRVDTVVDHRFELGLDLQLA